MSWLGEGEGVGKGGERWRGTESEGEKRGKRRERVELKCVCVCVCVCVLGFGPPHATHYKPTSHSCSYRCLHEASLALAELCIPTGLQLPQPVQLESRQQHYDTSQGHVGKSKDS